MLKCITITYMKMKKRNCLNCAFCIRHNNKFITFPHLINKQPFWKYSSKSLTDEERELLINGDDSFIGKAKNEYLEWIENYTLKKEAFEKQQKITIELAKEKLTQSGFATFNPLVDIVNMVRNGQDVISMHDDPYKDYSKYGIKNPKPSSDFPDEDYLSCWKQHWNEDKNNALLIDRIKLKNYCCKHYYPYNKLYNKSLELCDQERQEDINKKQFIATIVISVLTLMVSIITLALTFK